MTLCVLLGAGFSAAAGLPMMSGLFLGGELPPHKPTEAPQLRKVKADFDLWLSENPEGKTEKWLELLYSNRSVDLFGRTNCDKWFGALKYILRRLAEVSEPNHAPYYYGITRSNCHENHFQFWKILKNNGLNSIITLNYDILVERALHKVASDGSSIPEFAYGGFVDPHYVRKMINKAGKTDEEKYKLVKLGTKYNIYKLHGSLNWALEYHRENMKCHDDVRAIFRVGRDIGDPGIVPPLPEKNLPPKFATIWNQAEEKLNQATRLIVCGYSLPKYDIQIKRWLKSSLQNSQIRKIAILDPHSDGLVKKFREISPSSCVIEALPGLPDAAINSSLRNFLN